MIVKDPPVEVAENLWMLGTNAYPLFLVKGDREATVFEGGVGAMGPLLLEQLARLGVAAESIDLVIVTHAHPDHVMAVPLMRKAFGEVAVLASECAAKTLSFEKAVAFFGKIDGALTAALLAAGLITDAHKPEPLAEPRIAVDRTIKEGDTLQAGGMAFRVLETPGHSDCSLSFHEPARKILIISDATGYYLPEHEYWWPNYFTGYAAYVDSMKRLAALGAEVLCLSHNGVVTGAADVEAYFAGAIAATEAYHARIVADIQAGKDPRELAGQLGEEVYAKTQLLPVDFFQKNCAGLVKQSMAYAGIAPSE